MVNCCVACGAMLPAGAKVCEKCQWPVEGAEEEIVEEVVSEAEAVQVDEAAQNAEQVANQENMQSNQQMAYGQQMNYNGAQYQGQNMYGVQGQNGYMNQAAFPNQGQVGYNNAGMMPNGAYQGGVYNNQGAYPNNVYVAPNVYQAQPVYVAPQPQVQYTKPTIPPGSTLYRGKVYTEEEIEKMMPSFKKHAIVSLIFGLLGFLLVMGNLWFAVTSLVGFVFSIVGCANAGSYNANPKRERDGRATAGKVFGILGIIFGVFAMIFSIVAIVVYYAGNADITIFGLTNSDFSIFDYLNYL